MLVLKCKTFKRSKSKLRRSTKLPIYTVSAFIGWQLYLLRNFSSNTLDSQLHLKATFYIIMKFSTLKNNKKKIKNKVTLMKIIQKYPLHI